MITIAGFKPALQVVQPSPYVLKVMTFCQLNNIPYETALGIESLRNSPSKLLPYIVDGDQTVTDSHFIIQYLTQKYKTTLDEWLTPEQKTHCSMLITGLESGLQPIILQTRWNNKNTWNTLKEEFFQELPAFAKLFVPSLVRSKIIKKLENLGFSHYTNKQQEELAQEQAHVLSSLLGTQPYFLGDKPCSLDCSAYGFLAQLVDNPFSQESLPQYFQAQPNLVDYCQRLKQDLFSDNDAGESS